MATIKISALAAIAAASITATDVLPMTDADAATPTTYKATVANLRTAILAGGSGYTAADYLALGASAPSSGRLRIDGGTLTTSQPLLNGIQTWNDGTVAFTALLINVTNTASAAGALLADLQVGGASKWKVDKAGAVTQASTLTVSAGGVAVTAGGLTVSAGTSAVQALTATTITASSDIKTTAGGIVATGSPPSGSSGINLEMGVTASTYSEIRSYNRSTSAYAQLTLTSATFAVSSSNGTANLSAASLDMTLALISSGGSGRTWQLVSRNSNGVFAIRDATASVDILTASNSTGNVVIGPSGYGVSVGSVSAATSGSLNVQNNIITAGGYVSGSGISVTGSLSPTANLQLTWGGSGGTIQTYSSLPLALNPAGNAVTVGATLTVATGLTVSAGTSALQALTATTGTFTGITKAASVYATANAAPASGQTLGLAVSGGAGYLSAFDYTSTAYMPMFVNGSSVRMQGSGGLTVDAGGITVSAGGGSITGAVAVHGNIAQDQGTVAFTYNVAGGFGTAIVNQVTTASGSYGLLIYAGTNGSDQALKIFNSAVTATLFYISGDGHSVLNNTSTTDYGLTITNTNTTAGTSRGLYIQAGTNATDRVLNINDAALVNTLFFITGNGQVTTRDPFLRRANVTLTNGAAAATGTLTNAPAAGNPTKWLAVDDNGTTRYVPAW